MVYGLMRARVLERTGVFRGVRQPDRLTLAELTLQGEIRQVQEPLWSRREASVASLARQRRSLFAGATPAHFNWPAPLHHALVLRDLGVSRSMAATYVVASAWRSVRKTDASKQLGRGVDQLHAVKKLVKKAFNHTIYYVLVGRRAVVDWARSGFRKVG